jgi:putative FmdB family regulatory protein
MPIYAYRCSSCGHAKDVLQKLSDAALTVCPACGASSFAKQLTAAGFQLKGSGWYATDFKGGNSTKKADGDKTDAGSSDAPKPDSGKTETNKSETSKTEGGKTADGGTPAKSVDTASSSTTGAPKAVGGDRSSAGH